MEREEEVIYRKGMSKEELQEAKKKTKEEQIKAYTNEGAFAGMLVSFAVVKLIGVKEWWLVGLFTGIGAALGASLAHLEYLIRRKSKKPKDEQKQ